MRGARGLYERRVLGPAEITDCEPLHATARTPHAPVPTCTLSRASANHATPEPARSLQRAPPTADPNRDHVASLDEHLRAPSVIA